MSKMFEILCIHNVDFYFCKIPIHRSGRDAESVGDVALVAALFGELVGFLDNQVAFGVGPAAELTDVVVVVADVV